MRSVLLALALFLLTHGSRALAQDTSAAEARALVHYQSGEIHFERGNYERALEDFAAAYEESQRPGLLYNMFLCHERLGQPDEAITNLEAYLARAGELENRDVLAERLANLRARRDAQRSPGPTTQSTTEATDASNDSGPGELLAITGFSVAALGLVSFAIFGGLTLAEDARLDANCPGSCDTSAIGTYALVADLSAALALTGAIVGVVGLFLPRPSPSAPVVSLHFTGTGIALQGAF